MSGCVSGVFHGATQSRVRTQSRYLPGLRKLDRRRRILDRHAQAVCQHEGRAHLIHHLLIHDPTAGLGKALRLHQHVAARLRPSDGGQSYRQRRGDDCVERPDARTAGATAAVRT